jgi:clan AA aspartic protease (TIGR02281 family)
LKAAVALSALAVASLATHAHSSELACQAPVVEIGDLRPSSNPPVAVHVLYSAGAWRVTYRLADGSTIERASQYDIRDMSNSNSTSWSGTLYRRPQLRMTGEILRNSDTGDLAYQETIYAKGGVITMRMAAIHCDRLDQLTPAQSAPTPSARPFPVPTAPVPATGGFTVPIVQNGTRAFVAVEIGNIQPAPMLIDTGCTSMTVSEAIAYDLLAHGEAEALPDQDVEYADGSHHAVRQLRIYQIHVGGRAITDVKAGVTPNSADMLLGFPVLNQLGRFTIDTNNNKLIFG